MTIVRKIPPPHSNTSYLLDICSFFIKKYKLNFDSTEDFVQISGQLIYLFIQ